MIDFVRHNSATTVARLKAQLRFLLAKHAVFKDDDETLKSAIIAVLKAIHELQGDN